MPPEHAEHGPGRPGDTLPEPFGAALVEHLHAALASFGAAIAGLSVEELNRKPAPEANSLAVLVAHSIDTARSILHDLIDDPIPRNRQAAFELTDASEDDLRAMIDGSAAELDGLVERAMSGPLDRPVTRFREASQAWWLLQLLSHTREHAAHAALTRQLVTDRTAPE
jgi:hypothetical protein